MATWNVRRNTVSSERGGYVFLSPQDVQALVTLAGSGKLFTLCLDLHGMLTPAQDLYLTYKAGVQVHANELPYPELVVKGIETATQGIDNTFELAQKAIDHTFPLSITGGCSRDSGMDHLMVKGGCSSKVGWGGEKGWMEDKVEWRKALHSI
eukprot:scaffold34579_cov70-Cyclotella_meneghiniana.AAC.1